MATFEKFISTFSTNSNKKGDQFEYFVKEFLKNDLYWKSIVKTIWPFKDAPIKWGGKDTGTDLIFKDFEGRYWAVQAKKYAPDYHVKKEDINSFLTDSNRSKIYKRLLIIATDKIGSNAIKTIVGQEKNVVIFRLQDFHDKGNIYPDKFEDIVKFKKPEIPTPKLHQREAIKDVVQKFKKCSKGQLIMACGTGKTYTFFWIHKDLKSKKTLVLVPSLNLLSQTLEEWIKANGSSFTSLCICSDPSVAKNVQEDEIILEQSDIPYSVTWDVNEIVSFLKRPEPTVIFSTYQSSDLIAKAQKKVPNHMFDLSIADEAHRCTGKANSEFTTILDDKKIRSYKKLFGTATPKLYKSNIKKAAQSKEIEIIDMNDEEKFGVVLHNLSFGKAIKKKLLADYQVIVVGVNDARIKEMIDQREFISIKEDHKSDAVSLGAQVGFIKAIKDYNLSRLLTFHSRVKMASDFSKSLPEIYKWTKSKYKGNKELDIDYVSGKMQTSERRRKINKLKNIESNQVGILSNARCLGEGVDVPNMDGIAFINPKSSEIDIVQSIGRAIRKPDSNKSTGYIIIPVFIEDKDFVEESIESSAFEPVWKVMNALKSHDDNFKIELDNLRMNLGKIGIIGRAPKFVFDLPTKVTSKFQDKIETYLIEKVSESWYFFYGLLQKYYEKYSTSLVKTSFKYDGHNLGIWVGHQRQNFKKGLLSKERISKLDFFDDWSWKPLDSKWLNNFLKLKELCEKDISLKLTEDLVYEGLNLGRWVASQRKSKRQGRLDKYRINLINTTFPTFKWNPEKESFYTNLKIYKKYVDEYKKYSAPKGFQYDGVNLGNWAHSIRGKYRRKELTEEELNSFNTYFPNFEWDTYDANFKKKFNLLQQYYSEYGTSLVPQKQIYKEVALGGWVSHRRNDFKKGKLTKDRINLFKKTFHDWEWNKENAEWKRKIRLLKEYQNEFKTISMKLNTIYKGFAVGPFINRLRIAYKRDKLLKKRIIEIDQTFPDWKWPKKK